MAVQGPWVGGSAKAETGESWMAQAGSKLRIGLPFWMSQMIGQSVYNFSLNIQYREWNSISYRGSWQTDGWNWNPTPTAQNTIQGSFEGHPVTLFVTAIGQDGNAYWDNVAGRGQGTTLGILGGPEVNLRVLMNDGTTFDYTPGVDYYGTRNYKIVSNDEAKRLGFWFQNRSGQTVEGLIMRR